MSNAPPRATITEGGLIRPLFRLAWPIVVIQVLQVAYNIADTLWLGRYSADAVGALSLAFPLVFLLISVAGGFTAAGAILVAQYTGAESEGSAGKVAGQTITFVGLLAVVIGLVGFLLTDAMLGILPSSPATATQVVPLAADYMRVFFLGIPFLFGFYVFAAVMRGHGNTRSPMRVMAISVAINVVLDPFLIFGWWVFPQMGIEGAAIATIFSRGIASVLGFYILFVSRTGPAVELRHLVPDMSYIRDIVRIGVPSSLEQSMGSLAMLMLTAMVVTFTPSVVAAYGLGNRLISLVFLPAMGLGQVTNTMVGQNLGAGQTDRAERAVWLAVKTGAGVLVGVAIIAALFPEPIVGVFMATGTAEAAEVIEEGSQYLRIRSIEFAFIGVLQVLLGAFRGAGNTRTALALSVIALWIGRVPTVYFLAFIVGLGSTGIWIGMALGNILGGIAAALWFTRGTWKSTVIDDDREEPQLDQTPGVSEPDPDYDSDVDDA
ncbi:MAG: MATE family efflux transporter [Halobacteriales archaeon]